MADVVKVVNAGLAIITNLLSGLGGTVPKYVGWGTGTTPATTSDSGLETPSAESRTDGTPTRETDTVTNDTFQVVGAIESASTQAITEVGLFDAATSGNLFLHGTFSAINVNSGDSIQFTIKTVFADGS